MDVFLGIAGGLLGYGMPAIVLFAIAFVVAKSIKKNWPYVVATVLTVLIYIAVFMGLNYLKTTGQY